MYVCMDGWMDGWMDEWMDGWMEFTYVWTYLRMHSYKSIFAKYSILICIMLVVYLKTSKQFISSRQTMF